MTPFILKLDITWMPTVSFMLRPFYSTLSHELFIPRVFHFLMPANKSDIPVTNSLVLITTRHTIKILYSPVVVRSDGTS